MMEYDNDKSRNLKNVKQVGTPREENKIYIENMAYNKIKEENYKEKQVFVLMGHTERMKTRYATFVEAVIPVREMEFISCVPKWNNNIWSEVFREIKRLYQDMIVVGWAFDVKGMSLKLTPELERIHREHFGGEHQIFFLLDSIEQEETFYLYKENKMIAKDGFYIYYKARGRENGIANNRQVLQAIAPRIEPKIKANMESKNGTIETVQENEIRTRGRYRQLMQEESKPKKDGGNLGIAVAVAVLIFVIGVGVYENSESFFHKKDSIETNLLQNKDSTETNSKKESLSTESTEETKKDIIEVEIVPGND